MAQQIIPKQISEKIQNYLNILKKDKLPIRQAFLFGSFAKGTQKEWSDVDICIVSPQFENRSEAINYLWRKKHEIGAESLITEHDLEPIGYNPKDFIDNDPLVWEIKKYGREIKI